MALRQTWNLLVSSQLHLGARDKSLTKLHRLPANEPILHRCETIYISLVRPDLLSQLKHAWAAPLKESHRAFGCATVPCIDSTTKPIPTVHGSYSF